MTTEKKIELLADMLDLDPEDLSLDTNLDDLEEWDSLNALNLIALVDEEFGKTLSADVVNNLKTVSDIVDVMQ